MASSNPSPPFRAEHVGSFPRPERLFDARADFAADRITKDALKRIEVECIREIVAMQERVGIGAITDGEFPKAGWREFLFEKCDGFAKEPGEPAFFFTTFEGEKWGATGEPKCVGKVSRREALSADDFAVLKTMTKRPIKANLPTPSIAHFRGDAAFDRNVYPAREAYFADLARVMREEIADLAARGCTYLQMDEVPIAVLCDPRNRDAVRQRGEDPEQLIDTYIDAINQSLRDRPATMTVCVHMCRGNVGHGMADGGYESVAERMFNRLAVDGVFLEYDTPRAGDFAPLRFLPKGKRAVLGLVTTKRPEIESADSLKRRIDEASKVVPLDQLCLSPQCGFSSAARRGGRLTMDTVEAKLARIVEVADQVWG
jgi:5-methyltetrahydropteroyltriglutamate--homocysteine methyltransferase